MGLVEIYGLSNLYETFKEDGIMLYLQFGNVKSIYNSRFFNVN